MLKIYHEPLITVPIFILSKGMELFFFQEYNMMISSKKVKNKELENMI